MTGRCCLIITAITFRWLRLVWRVVIDDHFIYVTKYVIREPFPEFYKERRDIRLSVRESGETYKVLEIRVLHDLLDELSVRAVIFLLNEQ